MREELLEKACDTSKDENHIVFYLFLFSQLVCVFPLTKSLRAADIVVAAAAFWLDASAVLVGAQTVGL